MDWHAPLISPAHGAYVLMAICVFYALAWIIGRMLNDRRPIVDPIEEEFRGRR